MQLCKNDILVYRVDDKPKGWGKFIEEDKSFVRLQLQGGEKVKVPHKEILCNLGKEPEPGKVYGIEVDPEYSYTESKIFTEGISVRCKTEVDWASVIGSKFKAALKAKGCLRQLPTELKIYKSNSSKHGSYRYRGKKADTLKLFSVGDAVSDLQCLFHEYGHGLMFRYFGPKRLWFWTQLYAASTHIDTIDEQELEALCDTLQTAGSWREFVHDLEPDVKLILKPVLRYISQTYSLGVENINAGVQAGKSVKEYWPKAVDLVEREVVVTPYARKNPAEYWAESFALYMMGIKLPKRVEQGVINTLAGLKSSMTVEVQSAEESPSEDEDE